MSSARQQQAPLHPWENYFSPIENKVRLHVFTEQIFPTLQVGESSTVHFHMIWHWIAFTNRENLICIAFYTHELRSGPWQKIKKNTWNEQGYSGLESAPSGEHSGAVNLPVKLHLEGTSQCLEMKKWTLIDLLVLFPDHLSVLAK